MLVGGPSQLDTFDPKPDAPSEIRGPFGTIPTNAPGIRIAETLPLTAMQFDKVSVIRSLHHTATAVHETGMQLVQCGRLSSGGIEHPSIGCVSSFLKGTRNEVPAHVLLPHPIGNTGGCLSHGHGAGYLGGNSEPLISTSEHERVSTKVRHALDLSKEPPRVRGCYGKSRFAESCLRARRLIEAGVRFVTVNMFDTVYDEITWDIHGSKPFTRIGEMADEVLPNFDRAYSALLEDLCQRGLLNRTMVVATGEFGRTPRINKAGGRDHHTGVWSALLAGGPLQGGRIVGESDPFGYEPKNRPVTCAELCATIYSGLGIDPTTEIIGPQGRPIPITEPNAQPVRELF
jgi:hypothetical protein